MDSVEFNDFLKLFFINYVIKKMFIVKQPFFLNSIMMGCITKKRLPILKIVSMILLKNIIKIKWH